MNNKLRQIAVELTVQKYGPIDDYVNFEHWTVYREGVYAGLLEMLSLVNPMVNQAKSNAQRPQKPDLLREEISKFEESVGFERTFLTNEEVFDKIKGR
jgi:hypothetical protein